MMIECGYCKKQISDYSIRAEKNILAGKKVFCNRSCAARFRCGPIICPVHGPQDKSIQLRCLECHNSKIHNSIICPVHGQQEKSFNGRCMECHNRPVDCDIHGKQKVSLAGSCPKCRHKALHGSIICAVHGEQEKSFSGRCYKCMHGVLDCDIHGPEEKSFQGICIKCQERHKARWLIGYNDCPDHPDESKEVRHDGAYKCWSCIKESFALRSLPKISDSFWQATYRTDESSSAGQFMMEEELVERGVGWFVYIKGYIRDSAWIPLVVGKTGSRLVQVSGTDIRFEYDGQQFARTFLSESKLVWDTSKVLIIPVDSEIDAYKLEFKLKTEHSLFYS